VTRYFDGDSRFPKSAPLPVAGGIVARTGQGERFGETWWASRWISVLESFGWASRLDRGRRYARAGQVLSIDLGPGVVHARVQGSRPQPYEAFDHDPYVLFHLRGRTQEQVVAAFRARRAATAVAEPGAEPPTQVADAASEDTPDAPLEADLKGFRPRTRWRT